MALRPSRVAGVVAGCAALVAIAGPAASAQVYAGAGGDRVTVDGSTPSWATPQAKVGEADSGEQRHIQIALALRDPRGAEALAKSVSTPGSPNYKKFLSGQQFTDRFAASPQTVDEVSAWLRSQGLRVDGVSSNRHFIDVTASTGQLEGAFRVSLGKFKHTTRDGRSFTLTAPESPISVPREVRGAVNAVVGLDDSERTITTQQVAMRAPNGSLPKADPAADAAAAGENCARYWGEANNTSVPQKYGAGNQSNALCGYTSPQMRAIYGLSASNTGSGSTVGIVGAYHLDSIEADTNRAASKFGAPALTAGQYSAVLPSSYDNQDKCAPDSWHGEQALDVQSIHEIAPAAKITYYGAKSCLDLYNTLNKAVADNKVSIISNSWLYPGESTIPAATRDQMNSIAIQAAIQGQAIVFCSGDSGDNSAVNGKAEATYPASSPWVTAVGGTSVALDSGNKVKFSTGWESSGNTQNGGSWVPQQDKDGRFAGGAGGGVSSIYDAPDYQKDVVPSAISKGKRAMPDISALADSYTGIAIGYSTPQGWVEYSSGGTSLAAPLISALVANAQQAQNVQRMGFLNDALYAMRGGPSISDVKPVQAGVWTPGMASFGYVTVPSTQGSYLVDFDTKPQSLQSATGWDLVTGIGTPTTGFVTALGK